MERFGLWETRREAFGGTCGAALGGFANPRPSSGLIGAGNRTWPHLGQCKGRTRSVANTHLVFNGTLVACKWTIVINTNLKF